MKSFVSSQKKMAAVVSFDIFFENLLANGGMFWVGVMLNPMKKGRSK